MMMYYGYSLEVILKNKQFLILIPKLPGICAVSEKLQKMNSVDSPLRELRFCLWASPNMQQIVKQASPNRQLS